MKNTRRGAACAALLTFALAVAGCAPDPGRADTRGNAAPEQAGSSVPYWVPAPGASWQWQLSGALDFEVDAEIFDVDYETTTQADLDRLKQDGRRTVCYLSVGSWEEFRPDAAEFPDAVLGEVLDGWPDERWLDIRRTDLLLPIMAARMDTCVDKGFDAVEPDNVDGYQNESGFGLTADDQLAYNRAIAGLAHDRGLSVALKNDLDQIPELVDSFDFAVNEECILYDECDLYTPFTEAGKAVLHVEYQGELDFCAESRRRGFSSMLKPLDLTAERWACPADAVQPVFTDVPPGTQFYDEILWMAEAGISTGWLEADGTRTYRPLQAINRDAMAAFMYRLDGSPDYTPPQNSPFTDVGTANPFYKEIAWLYSRGISTGWTEGNGTRTYRPLQPVNRDAMAAFLHRFAGSPDYTAPPKPAFQDVPIGNAFYREISWLASSGISTGWTEANGTTTFRPLTAVKRDAMAAFMKRFDTKYGK